MADQYLFVRSLRMQNFRCFDDLELGPFDPQFNLIVGENGAGKSSILLALANLFREVPMILGGIASPPLLSYDDRRTKIAETGLPDVKSTVDISSNFEWLNQARTVQLQIGFKDGYDLRGTGGMPLSPKDFANSPVPLFLLFRAGRQFRRTLPASGDPVPSLPSQRGDAFHNWATAGDLIDNLIRWWRDETIVEFERAREANASRWADGKSALELVRHACRAAIEGSTDFSYNGTARDIVVVFSDGRKLALANMSDGQRALVGLVADVARRSQILNGPVCGADALEQTPGVVLIDEIDLHLHPKWQRQIVPALKKIFPKIQFFATTHSPQVIGECEPKEIVLLTKDGKQGRPPGSFGMDSNWILQCVMDASDRDVDIAKKIAALSDLIDEGKLAEAKAEIAKLRQQLPDVAPDIVSAEAYIWNLEHEPDEAAE